MLPELPEPALLAILLTFSSTDSDPRDYGKDAPRAVLERPSCNSASERIATNGFFDQVHRLPGSQDLAARRMTIL